LDIPEAVLKNNFPSVFIFTFVGIVIMIRPVLYAQDFTSEVEDALSEVLDPDTATTDELEEQEAVLAALAENPVNINRANERGLAQIPLLPEAAIQRILSERQRAPFASTWELIDRGILDAAAFELVRPFLTAEAPPPGARLTVQLITTAAAKASSRRNEPISFIRRTNLSAYTNGYDYPEIPPYLDSKLILKSPGLFESIFSVQHDAFERDLFDLVKYALQVNSGSILQQVCLGALSVNFGQRLVYTTSTGYGGRSVTPNRVSGIDISRGMGETYLNGVGLTLRANRLSLHLVYGYWRYDAALRRVSPTGEYPYVTGFELTAPAHDNIVSIGRRHALREQNGVFCLEYAFNHQLTLGVTGLLSRFSVPVIPEPGPYQFYQFAGRGYGAIGVHWKAGNPFFNLWGEVAVARRNDTALQNWYAPERHEGEGAKIWRTGLAAFLEVGNSRRVSWINSVHLAQPGFPMLHSSAVGANEDFLSSEMTIRPFRILRFRLGVGAFTQPWRSSSLSTPASSGSFSGEADWRVYRSISLKSSWVQRNREAAVSGTSLITAGVDNSWRLTAEYRGRSLTLRSQSSLKQVMESRKTKQTQYMTLDADFQPVPLFSIDSRIGMFDAENDTISISTRSLPGMMSVTPLTGKGVFLSFLPGFELRHFSLIARIAFISQMKRDSNGNNEPQIREEVGMQLGFTF